MSPARFAASAFAIAGLLFADLVSAQVQRTFVASFGNDANTASNCSFLNPCRGFTAAHGVTTAGGEIVALDAAGYGAITITKSITITANPGVYAGIAASTGSAVTIATTGVKATLRGLNINGIGASTGIMLTDGAGLIVENCELSGFSNNAIEVHNDSGVVVQVVNTVIRNNGNNALRLYSGTRASITGSKLLSNSSTALVAIKDLTSDTVVSVFDTTISGNLFGVATSGAGARVSVLNSAITNNTTVGLQNNPSAYLAIGNSLVTGNGTTGLVNSGGTLESQGNNLVRDNALNTSGAITNVGGT